MTNGIKYNDRKIFKPNHKFHQGFFNPINKDKYVGDVTQIIYRSGLERQFMIYCDTNPRVLSWGSEIVKIRYFFPIENKYHWYIIDFWYTGLDSQDKVKKFLIELKPKSQVIRPKLDKMPAQCTYKTLMAYNQKLLLYLKNIYKWKAAKEYARKINCEFIILTDEDLKKLITR